MPTGRQPAGWRRQLVAKPGEGAFPNPQAVLDYAAAHCRVLLHDFSRIPIDTSVVAYLRANYGCDPAEFAVIRSQWGPYLALGYRVAQLSDKLAQAARSSSE